jgi:hypothetical protein
MKAGRAAAGWPRFRLDRAAARADDGDAPFLDALADRE